MTALIPFAPIFLLIGAVILVYIDQIHSPRRWEYHRELMQMVTTQTPNKKGHDNGTRRY